MNSRKTNLRLIENITVQVPNTASISKGILRKKEASIFNRALITLKLLKFLMQHPKSIVD